MSESLLALVIPVHDTPYLTVLHEQSQRRMPELWELVGNGWYSMIHPCADPCHAIPRWHAYMGENADIKGQPVNPRASRLAVKAGWHLAGDVLMGPVVFTGCAAPDCAPVPQKLLDVASTLGIRPMRSIEHEQGDEQCQTPQQPRHRPRP